MAEYTKKRRAIPQLLHLFTQFLSFFLLFFYSRGSNRVAAAAVRNWRTRRICSCLCLSA
jgi:hypothetical protein